MATNQSKGFRTVLFIITCALVVIAWYVVLKRPTQPVVERYDFSGKTMGTTYSICFYSKIEPEQLHQLYAKIDEELIRINKLMSIYDPSSEISTFNASTSTAPMTISPELATVMDTAMQLAEESNGAFDPTVGNLVNLWGFGPKGRITNPPTEEQINQTRAECGWHHLSFTNLELQKDLPALEVDLGAIAKGYGVDVIAFVLEYSGISNYVVEIGGETRAGAQKPDETPWRIGLQKPKFHAAPGEALIGIIEITDKAIATSGDYQNFFIDEEEIIHSHIIDPRTGYPAKHTTASVTVVADTCMLADGLATALYVMGPEEGLQLVEQHPGVEALFVIRQSENDFAEISSSGFTAATAFKHE